MEYQGELLSSDSYMNLQLGQTQEFIQGNYAGFLGEVLIRCNNVLYIKAAEEEDEGEEESPMADWGPSSFEKNGKKEK